LKAAGFLALRKATAAAVSIFNFILGKADFHFALAVSIVTVSVISLAGAIFLADAFFAGVFFFAMAGMSVSLLM
jgi:hypothetical protein